IPWNLLRAASVAAALSVVALIVAKPDLVFGGLSVGPNGLPAARWGPLHGPLVVVPYFVSFAAALAALHAAARRAPTPATRGRAATTLAGLGLYLAFASGNHLAYFAVSGPDLLYAALFAATAAGVLGAVRAWAVAAREAPTPREQRIAGRVAVLLAVPLVWGAVEGLLASGPFPRANTVGLWRLAGVGIVAYGILRHSYVDLPERARRGATFTAGIAGSAALGAAAFGATGILAGGAAPGVVGLAVFAATVAPAVTTAQRLLGRASRSRGDADALLYGQRIETYRSALEAAIARSTLGEEREFLESLRARLRISPDEDRLLQHYARSAVLLPRGRSRGAAYDRLRLLGEGAEGRTYLARDRARDALVVLKEPLARWHRDPRLREAAIREARLAAKVRHPNVVRVLDVAEEEGRPVLVLEYLDGGSLADHLEARGKLPWREAVEIASQLASGLSAVHAAGIVHRDVKPSNILFASDGTVKLADFGIALRDDAGRSLLSAVVGPSGTVSYLATEVRDGRSRGNERTDLYAAAAVLHECLTGLPPAEDGVASEIEGPAALRAFLSRGLDPDPFRRPAAARQFLEDLSKVVP
ncbi:MAG: serine/threonine-protein kinase, partial [Methanobacteriota archaeon]